MPVCCRYAPSLGALEGTPEQVWGTVPYDRCRHRRQPCVFFGLYDLRDYLALLSHKGKAWVLWAGSDIRNLAAGFIFNDGKLRWLSRLTRGRSTGWIVRRILSRAEHWVENTAEATALERMGVKVSGICPSYMGQVDMPISYSKSDPAHAYLSSPPDRQEEYGFGLVEKIAGRLPNVIFHLYGAPWKTLRENVVVHGRVPKAQMNGEIRNFQIGLRLNEFDGFSEILAKAVLMGQFAIGRVRHPMIPTVRDEKDLVSALRLLSRQDKPHLAAREWYRKNLNNYPWNTFI